ncbi:hypothetical protein DL764_009948 [Monosporascus ibericus]|uniref:NADP-dependent oxidoreductase domain-containing protein n=1 Tax=Monosporascus ibericus TaxID=155417 RepID=A0A4Q4SVN4_9PEZI|nr:hypothetical protein DL764_009948 [Monosporascus ibericus]
MATDVPSIKLASGYDMPLVGFGMWKVRNETCAAQSMRWSKARLENEAWGIGYLDLFLIHFPIAPEFIPFDKIRHPCFWTDKEQTQVTPLVKVPIRETWQMLEELVQTKNPNGVVRSVGVSEFHTQLIYDVLSYNKLPLSTLQIEHHPYLTQPELIAIAQENGIAVTGYSTFGPQSLLELGNAAAQGVKPLFETDVVKSIAEKHGKSPGQVLLRGCKQRNIIVIPKSNSVDRLKQNLSLFDFNLSEYQIKQISSLDRGLRFNVPNTLQRPIRTFT